MKALHSIETSVAIYTSYVIKVCLDLKMKAVWSFETSVAVYTSVRHQGLLGPENEGTAILRNVGNYLQADAP
jgi:hypothetical protein